MYEDLFEQLLAANDEDELIEKFADLAHKEWMAWAKKMLTIMKQGIKKVD